MEIKRILVPIDFSEPSAHALAYAAKLARSTRAELVLLHVIDQTYLAGTVALRRANPRLAELLEGQWRSAQAEMTRICARQRRTGRRVRALLRRGSPAAMIVNTAKREDADLIVMATHGRTGVAHLLIGSVAEKVVRTAACAVLTVRHRAAARR